MRPASQTLDLSYSSLYIGASSLAGLVSLRSLNLSGCRFERSILRALPRSLSSLSIDRCKRMLDIDDNFLAEVITALWVLWCRSTGTPCSCDLVTARTCASGTLAPLAVFLAQC